MKNFLDTSIERAQVQRMIDEQNTLVSATSSTTVGRRLRIKPRVSYTGYLISPADTHFLLNLFTSNIPEAGTKYLANSILITPQLAPQSILDRVGGIGSRLLWQVTGTGVFENKIWACRVKPVPETGEHYTENPVPMVVIALRKNASPADADKIQSWQPVPPEKKYVFETVVGEKEVMLIEEDGDQDENHEKYSFNSILPDFMSIWERGTRSAISGNVSSPG